jgi:hypothetical protein
MILVESGIRHKRVEIPQLTKHNVCNPSIVATPQGYECTVRAVNYDLEKADLAYEFFYGSYSVPFPDTQNYYAVLNNDLEIQHYWFLEDRHLRNNVFSLDGIEDLRLFYWKGERYVIGGAINYPSQCSNITLMKLEGNVLERIGMFGSPTKATTEKNWMPFVQGEALSFLYTPNGQVLTYGESLEFTHTDRPIELPNWSGSSCVMERDGKYYAMVHQRVVSNYTHKLVEYDATGKPLWQSQEFSFERVGIEFCAGMAFKGDDVVFSYGVMDKKAVLLKMKFNDFMGVVK